MEGKSRLERATEWAEQIMAAPAATDPDRVVVLDSRKRASLAKLKPDHTYYRARKLPDGTIILSPVVMLNRTGVRNLRKDTGNGSTAQGS